MRALPWARRAPRKLLRRGRVHQRVAVHHPTRVDGGELLLRVFEQLCRRAVDEDFCVRRAPQYLVEDVVRAVGHVGNAVAVEVEGGVVAPVVALAVVRPFVVARADVHDLRLVVDEAVAVVLVVGGACGAVDAEGAVFKVVVVEGVAVSVVEEDAFVGALDAVAVDFGVVDRVQHQPVFAAVLPAVVAHGDAVGEHDDVGGLQVFGVVVRDFAVFGVHIVHAEAHIAHGVVLKQVVFAVGDVDAVAAAAQGVVADDGVRAFPDLDGVAPVVDPAFVLADDDVVFDQRVFRPPDVEAEEVVFGAVVVDVGARRLAVGEDAGVHVELAVAGMAHGEVFDGAVRCLEVQHFAFAAAVQDGFAVRAAAQGNGGVDGVVALPGAGREGDVVAGLGGVKRGL